MLSYSARDKAKGGTRAEYIQLVSQSRQLKSKKMEDVPPSWVGWKEKSCPIGYSALTLVHIGGHPVQVCLDSGASVSAIPEELFLILLDQAVDDEDEGILPIADKRYAIQEIEQYLSLIHISEPTRPY